MNHYTRWLELKEQNPGKYARDIAGLMNISEAELAFERTCRIDPQSARAGFTSVSQSMGQCFPHQRKHGSWRTPEYSVL